MILKITSRKEEAKMEATKRINIAIDETLHKELKIAAAVNGTTLKEYVANAIKESLNKDKTKTERKP